MIHGAALLTISLATATAPAPAASPAAALAASARARLAADDLAGALADAEAAVAAGGGAEAYAVRGEAKRALGRPIAGVLDDYAEAARLDRRYAPAYQGFLAQRDSNARPDRKSDRQTGAAGVPSSVFGVLGGVGVLFVMIGALFFRRRPRSGGAPPRA